MNLSVKQKQIHRQRTDMWLPMGRDELRVWDQQMQTVTYRRYKQGLTVQHKKLYSIYCNSHNGKIMKKDIYIYLNHFVMHQKLIQHYKSTILQQNILKKETLCVLILPSEGFPSLPTQHLISILIFAYFSPENLY